MKIRTNMQSMRANSNLRKTNGKAAKTMEKLSSGFGINRASDNAAGLAISEKMRSKLASLNRDIDNAYEGIDLAQTAEGALNEMHEIFRRVLELSEQSANGTYDDEVDRQALQAEVDQLMEESDRIVEYTNFNGIFPLKDEGVETVESISSINLVNSDSNTSVVDMWKCYKEHFANYHIKDSDGTEIYGSLDPSVFDSHFSTIYYNDRYGDPTGSVNKMKSDFVDSGAIINIGLSFEQGGNIRNWSLNNVPVGYEYRCLSYYDEANASTNLSIFVGLEEFGDTFDGNSGYHYDERYDGNKKPFFELSLSINDDDIESIKNGNITGTEWFSVQISQSTNQVSYIDPECGVTRINFSDKTGKDIIGSTITLDNGNMGKYQFVNDSSEAADDCIAVVVSEDDSAENIAKKFFSAMKTGVSTAFDSSYEYSEWSEDTPDIIRETKSAFSYHYQDCDQAVGWYHGQSTFLLGGFEPRIYIERFSDRKIVEGSNPGIIDDYRLVEEPIKAEFIDSAGSTSSYSGSSSTKDVSAVDDKKKSIGIFVGDSNKSYNWIKIPTFDMHVKNLGLEGADVSTQEAAAETMDKVKTAINRVSEVRGQYGAVINRLDHAVNNLDETMQNEQASESTIRDADMAKEMTQMTIQNMLMQSGTAMLAQANSLPNSILSLLQ